MPKTKLGNFIIHFENSEEYHSLKSDVFADNSYQFETDNPFPVIIDAGANIGLATIYFKKVFPGAKIIAVEPLPINYKLLELNVFENNLSDVMTYEYAISNKTKDIELHTDFENNWHSTASIVKGNWTRTQPTQPVVVPTKPLSFFIDEAVNNFGANYIDLLKMDIEGAEQSVLIHDKKHLEQKVKFINCEFHPHPDQNIAKLVKTLEESGFIVTLFKKGKEVRLDQAKVGLVVIEARNSKL